MDALKLGYAANTDAVKEEKPAVHFHTDSGDATERTIIGDAAKDEKPELGLPPADHHYASPDGQSAIIDSLLSVKFGNPIVIAPMKMEADEPVETTDTDFTATIGSRDKVQREKGDPTMSGVMTVPQQNKPRPYPDVSLGADPVGSKSQNVKFDPRIRSLRQICQDDNCNAYATLGDDKPQQTISKPPSAKQIDKNHTGEKPHQCTVCTKSFSRSSYLKTHMRTHTGEKPHQCTVCSKSFSRSGSLKSHMYTHGGEKPYQCTVCFKSYCESGTLKTHMYTHKKENPYHCTVCTKSFTHSIRLKTHMRTHTGEKAHPCIVCSKSFSRFCDLKKHMRTHTGENPH